MGSDIRLSPAGSTRLGFLDLPEEIQKEIFGHCSQSDWTSLCLVSRHFRYLAADRIYRSFNIVFPDEDDESFDSPVDGLAGGLDTFVTSEYNYAQHLRDIKLDTLSVGTKAESAYKTYLLSLSCGKFMNTLLLLTLRRAKSLDTFKWNIRVELSRPVYRALHNIKSLRHLHIRLPDGPSLYEPPPTNWTAANNPASTPAVGMVGGPGTGISGFSTNTLVTAPSAESSAHRPSSEGNIQKSVRGTEQRALSGFKGLDTLAILDIDNLDSITEIGSCVHNSAFTLRKLKLSFSDDLASLARPTNMEVDSEDSDQEDDFQVVNVAPYINGNKTLAQQRRKEQETALGQIFEYGPFPVKEHSPVTEEPSQEDKVQDAKEAGQAFIDAVEKASRHMWANLEGYREVDVMSQQEVMDQIITAARFYVDSKLQAQESTSAHTAGTAPVGTSAIVPGSARQGDSENRSGPSAGNEHTTKNVLFGHLARAEDVDTNPEDIDVDVPEEQLGLDEHDGSSIEDQSDELDDAELPVETHKVSPKHECQCRVPSRLSTSKKPDRLKRHANEILKDNQQLQATGETSADQLEKLIDDLVSTNCDRQTAKHEANPAKSKAGDVGREAKSTPNNQEELRRQVTDYARGTRGIALRSLAIHLIPTRASILGRAVDLRTLTKITLLNVGPQSAIWGMMIKENNLQPLPLQKIFTDNVCLYFLQLVSQLERVEELLMLERGHKYKPESLAPKTKVNIGQIRRAILKKHMHTLQILMIKNNFDGSWDIDDKTMQCICRRGKVLRELAVAAGISSMHTLLRHITYLKNLFALHFVSFRSDDTCVSVMREIHRFVADALWRHQDLKLEWVAIGGDGHAQHLMRRPDSSKKIKKGKEKSNWKAPPVGENGHWNESGYPVFPANTWEPESDSDEEDDDSRFNLVLAENIAFYDIWGVRIFKKEIVAGRL